MFKKVFDFNYWLDCSNSTCDVYKACGYIQGKCFDVKGGFSGYSQKDIIKKLKDLIKVEANKYFNNK